LAQFPLNLREEHASLSVGGQEESNGARSAGLEVVMIVLRYNPLASASEDST